MELRKLAKVAAVSATALALCTGVAGCRAGQGQLAGTPTSSAGTVTGASGTAAPVPASTSGAENSSGSVTTSLTSPVSLSGTVSAPVSCSTGRTYRASVTSAEIQGATVSFAVVVVGYRGSGSYPAVVDVTLRQSSGVVTTVAGVSRIPAVLTSAGGSFSVSATGSGGRTVAGSLSWVCGS